MNTNATISTLNCTGIKTLCLLFFLFYGFASYSQYFSNLYYDNRPAMLFGSIKVQRNSYYVTGVTNRNFSPYYQKALFGKIDPDGIINSIYVLADSDTVSCDIFNNSLKRTADGNFLATGEMFDSLDRAFIVKWDTVGNILFWHTYSQAQNNMDLYQGMDVLEIQGKGYLLAVNYAVSSGPYNLVTIIRTDTVGNILNRQAYSITSDQTPTLLRPMNNGNYIVGAYYGKQGYPSTPYWAYTWLIEVDNMCNKITQWIDNSSTNLWPNGMQQTADSAWIIVRQHMVYDMGNEQVYKASILKLNSSFQKVWEMQFSDSTFYNSTLYDVEQLADGNFIACGIEPVWGLDSANLYGWLIKFSTDSTIIWEKKYLAASRFGTQSFLYDVNELPNGDLLACGELDYAYNVGITPVQQGWILRTDSNGCLIDQCWLGINDVSSPYAVVIKEYPNPATNEIIFETGEGGNAITLTIYNLYGQKVFESKLNNALKVQTGLWQQAIYVWQARQDGYPVGQGKVEVVR